MGNSTRRTAYADLLSRAICRHCQEHGGDQHSPTLAPAHERAAALPDPAGGHGGSGARWVTLLPQTALVLRWDRTVDTMANAAFGADVHYQEQATFLLESLTPTS